MIKLIFSLLIITSFAKAHAKTEIFKCSYKITNIATSKVFNMTGIIQNPTLDANTINYLSLEPPSSMDIAVTARLVLARYEGEDYIPMSLHKSGNTAEVFEFIKTDSNLSDGISFNDAFNHYEFNCKKL